MDLSKFDTGEEIMDTAIYYSRPLKEYPTAQTISDFISQNGNLKNKIYTKDLNSKGLAVQDSMEKYLEKEAYQSSHFKQALISPLHLQFSLDEDKRELEKLKKNKGSFELGTFIHQCILEPTKFSRVIVEPNHSLSTSQGVENLIKFWKESIEKQDYGFDLIGNKVSVDEVFKNANEDVLNANLDISKQDGKKAYYRSLKKYSGLEAIEEEHFLKIKILKKHYENYGGGILRELLLYSKREISFYINENGLELKCRPDAIQFEENIGVNAIISIKSTSCEDLRAFNFQAAKLNYDLTEGMYQEIVSKVTGRDFNTTIMIMLQTVPPFGIAVLVWSGEDIETGKYKFRTAFDIALRCKEKNNYMGYDIYSEEGNFGLIDMHLPGWNNKELLPTN